MKKKITWKIFSIGCFLIFSCALGPSCTGPSRSQVESQRAGLMMQDKSEYSRNKRHYKGSKAYKKKARRTKRYKKNRMRR